MKFVEFFEENVGRELWKDELHMRLDILQFEINNPRGRVQKLNHLLLQAGLRVKDERRNNNGKRETLYTIQQRVVRLTPN